MVLEGWFFVAATLLALSGGAKTMDPGATSSALRAASLPSSVAIVRALGALEILTSIIALTVGGRTGGVAVAAVYLAFAAFVAMALRRKLPLRSCGCFGRADTPPTLLHLVVNLTAAGAAGWVAFADEGGLPEALSGQPALGLPYLGFLLLGVFAMYLLLARLPETMLLVRR